MATISHPLLPKVKHPRPCFLSKFFRRFVSASIVRFVAAAFLATVFIPDSGDSGAPYFLHLAIPFFVVKGVQEVRQRAMP